MVGEGVIGIDHGVKALQVGVQVRIAQGDGDGVRLRIQLALALLGGGLPLAGGLLEADVAVGGHAVAVHEDADACLVAGGINVVKGHHVDAFAFEIPGGGIELKAVCLCRFFHVTPAFSSLNVLVEAVYFARHRYNRTVAYGIKKVNPRRKGAGMVGKTAGGAGRLPLSSRGEGSALEGVGQVTGHGDHQAEGRVGIGGPKLGGEVVRLQGEGARVADLTQGLEEGRPVDGAQVGDDVPVAQAVVVLNVQHAQVLGPAAGPCAGACRR